MRDIWQSFQFKIPAVFVISSLLIFLAIFAVFATIGKTLLEKQAYKQVTLAAENIVAQLGTRIAFTESLAISLANLGETLPKDIQNNKAVIQHVLNAEGTEAFIAGGGIWPAPNQYDPQVERRSFFWGRDASGVLQYFDDYNNPQGPGYHHEEWYVPAKHLPAGKAFWSKSYMDPYSYQPMVTVTVPMFKNNVFYGVSTVDLKLEGLSAILQRAASVFGGYAFAVDRNGKFLSFPNEQQTKIFGKDTHGRKTEEFISVKTLAQKQAEFKTLADSILETIASAISETRNAGSYDHTLAEKIADDSYQIDLNEAELITALLARNKQPGLKTKLSVREFFLEQDMLLGEPAYAAVFDMPETYWKIITVMPYSKAIEASNVIYRNLILSITIAMLISLVIVLFMVRKLLVKPVSHVSRQLQTFTEQDECDNKRLETSDKGELGKLVFWFNKRSDKLLTIQNELLETQNELEQRVHDRTEKLRIEIENSLAQQREKERLAERVERQHNAVVELSLHQCIFCGDISQAARVINKSATQVLNVARASVWLLDDAEEQLYVVDMYNSVSNTHDSEATLNIKECPVYFQSLLSERSIAAHDIAHDERTVDLSNYANHHGINALLNSPIRVAGKLRGSICFEHIGGTRQWQNDEIRFAGEIADLLHQVISNAERIQTDNQIRKLAFFDPLTDLANRRFLQETLQHEIEVARRQNKFGSLLYLDLDNFKTLNDSLGHSIGDELLMQLSQRIRQALRKEDMPARLGGDEFVILLAGEHPNKKQAMEQALYVANKIQAVICQPYRLHGYEHIITASIGITLYPEEDSTVTNILKQADTAMYRAKDHGRNTITFYNNEFQETADRRLLLEKELRHAIANNEFEMYYQPQVDAFGNLIGTEALIRWMHPTRGCILPLQFIPIAEDTGLILEIGNWIFKDACEFSNSHKLDRVAINISPRQFRSADFVDSICHMIDITGADPKVLMLEVTEGIVIDNIEDTIQKMNALKALGIRFAIDDFGTGYSSLAYLKQLPLDQLKINDKFVRDVTSDASDAIIAETIILMARHLGLNVVAEGVETNAQLQFLIAKNCQIFQGYLFSHPLCRQDFKNYFKLRNLSQASY